MLSCYQVLCAPRIKKQRRYGRLVATSQFPIPSTAPRVRVPLLPVPAGGDLSRSTVPGGGRLYLKLASWGLLTHTLPVVERRKPEGSCPLLIVPTAWIITRALK